MKDSYLLKSLFALVLLFSSIASKAQQNDDLLNLLIKKNVLTEQEADSIRADQAIKEQAKKDKENQHGIALGKALQISGLIQTRYQGFQQKSVPDAFDIHRARIDFKGDLNSQWSYEVYTEFAGTTKLLDAYTTYKIADFLKFTAGQFKVPFSAESLQPDASLEFIDRSQVVEALAGRSKDIIGNQNGRDIGAQLSGSFAKVNENYLFDYYFGVFNGAGYDVTTDNTDHKDIAGRLAIHPINNLSIGADFYNGRGFYAIGNAAAASHKRNREGIDARFITGGLSLTGEYDRGTDATTQKDGWFAQATYFVLPKILQLAARYDTFDPSQVIGTDRTTNYVGGINYFFNQWAKFTVDYLYRREETPAQILNNILEAQLQLTF